jgi:starch phosphorylase
VENVVGRDPFAVIADFGAYREAQAAVDAGWADPTGWLRRSLLSTARSGFFSSDRAIRTDAETIWQVSACPVTITCPLDSCAP